MLQSGVTGKELELPKNLAEDLAETKPTTYLK
jgi:hypothetical protein